MAAAACLMPSSISTLRVRYAETDKMGVVYYANYLVWFEVARTDLLRTLGWTYREMEHAGVSLPVIEAHCEYHRPARYDDEIEIRTEGRMLSPVRMEFRYEVFRQDEPGTSRRRAARCTRRSNADGRPCRLPDARSRGVRMKALVTGAAGFIGSHLAAALLDDGRDGRRHRLLHRLLPARDQGSQSRGERAAARASASSKRRIQDADLPALLDGVTHVFHLAAQAGVRKSWGKDFRDLHREQRRGHAAAARGLRRAAARALRATRRARRSTATARRSRCARTRCRSRSRRTA